MLKERQSMRRRLDDELIHLTYDQQESILRRTHPRTWSERARAFWNREVELPLIPIGIVIILMMGWPVYQHVVPDMKDSINRSSRQMIEVGGSTYWKDAYERAMVQYENKNKN
jgi:hypothetical protein